MEWVIDTDVLGRAQNYDDNHDHWSVMMRLLSSIGEQDHLLAVDGQHEILGEYYSRLGQDGWVQKWVSRQIARGRVMYYSGGLTINLSRGLRELHFHDDDDVFVAVATRTSTGALVAEESDYTQTVISLLSEHGVRVMDCEAAKIRIDYQSSWLIPPSVAPLPYSSATT